MNKIKNILGNKWVKFALVTALYLCWFVLWGRNWWMLLGVVIIYDIYISKYMYRWFWKRHKDRKKSSRTYKKSSEWVEAILFAVVAASLIRVFFFEMYVIPSSSMEKSLLVNDYLCVSKVTYGPRTPMTPLSFPLVHHTMPLSQTKKSFSEAIKRPYKRLAGTGSIKRGDIVVFNFPDGDTVLLERQNDLSYYDALRQYESLYGSGGRAKLHSDFTVITRPVDKRENYVKRCVGMPGDSVQIIHSQLFINGEPFTKIPRQQYNYFVFTDGSPLSTAVFDKFGITREEVYYNQAERWYCMPMTDDVVEKIKDLPGVTAVVKDEERDSADNRVFPHEPALFGWNTDNFGALWVPQKGTTIDINPKTLPLYSRIIGHYEGNRLETRDGVIYINGSAADSYTFKMNYYFMLGDNRHMSLDSRYWGFVPEDHIVGKPIFVWMSIDKDKGWFGGKMRWSRMFRSLKIG